MNPNMNPRMRSNSSYSRGCLSTSSFLVLPRKSQAPCSVEFSALPWEWLRLKVHSKVHLSCLNCHISYSIKLTFQESLSFKMGWVICFYSAYIQFLVQVSYRKTFTVSNIQKLTIAVLSSSSLSPKGNYKEERASYFSKHWTLNGSKYSKTLLWLVDFQRVYTPKFQPSREKAGRKLGMLLLWELPSQMYIHFNHKNKTHEVWVILNFLFLHT